MILIFPIFFFSFSAASQQVNFINYTVYDGLVANPVRCIYQDHKGFIWIGTYDGLSRYDGHRFTNYTNANGLSHNFINAIIEVNGNILIGENNGAVDVIENNAFRKTMMAESAVNRIAQYGNRLLLSTDEHGFYEYKDDILIQPKQQKTGTPLGHFIPVNDSLLLSDGVDNHLVLFKKDLSIVALLKDVGFQINFLLQDSKKRIWACTSSGLKLIEIIHSAKASISFKPLPPAFSVPVLRGVPVTSIIEDKNGSYWIGTWKGLVHVQAGGDYYVYNEKDGLPSSMIYTLYQDKEHNLWIGTALGLAKWVLNSHIAFFNTEHHAFRNDVSNAYRLDNRKIILSTDHGLQQLDLETRKFRDINFPLSYYHTPVQGSMPLLV